MICTKSDIAGSCFLALSIGACYLPGKFTEPASPPIVGEFRRANGVPGPGARVAVSSDYRDATCTKASEHATTDSSGEFRLGSTTITRHGAWLVPAIEHFANGYTLCVGTVDTSLRMAYSGTLLLNGHERERSDSLKCLEWIWEDNSRITCAGPRRAALQSGGRWTQGSAVGFYRLIIAGDGLDARKAGVFLQWVQQSDRGPPEIVRATIELPLAPHLLELKEARLSMYQDRASCVSVRSTGKPLHFFSWDMNRVNIALELGPPGETRRVSGCSGPPSPE